MDSLLVDHDHGYRSRRNSTSSSDDGRETSSPPPASGLHDTRKRIAHHVHRHHHHHSKSHSSDSMNAAEGIGGGGGVDTGGSSGLQERIFAKLMHQMLPSDYTLENYSEPRDRRRDKNRPQFSLTTMSSNFRRFNARCAPMPYLGRKKNYSNPPNHRIGVVFVFQHRLLRLLQWQKPSHTLSALAVYSFVCLDPYLIALLPVACILFFIMVPSFIIRHPPPPSMPMEKYTAHGPAIAPPPEVKAVSEMSKVSTYSLSLYATR